MICHKTKPYNCWEEEKNSYEISQQGLACHKTYQFKNKWEVLDNCNLYFFFYQLIPFCKILCNFSFFFFSFFCVCVCIDPKRETSKYLKIIPQIYIYFFFYSYMCFLPLIYVVATALIEFVKKINKLYGI